MGETANEYMKAKMAMMLAMSAVLMLWASDIYASSADQNTAQRIIDAAQITLNDFIRNPKDISLRANLEYARAVLIFPKIVQGGFLLGGSGGTGVMLVRDKRTGDWSHPAFLRIGSVSLGLQLGGGVAEVVILAMNQEALDSLFLACYTVGGNASIAIGSKGSGFERSRSLPGVVGRFSCFAQSKGLYAGLNLTGSYIAEREDLERAYYGVITWLEDIVLMDRVSNKGSDALRETISSGNY